MNNVTAFTIGAAQFTECRLVHEFLDSRVRTSVEGAHEAAPSAESATILGVLLRVVAWTNTLSKLDEPADYQAAVVASRTLFEVAVDMTLIHFDPIVHPIAKLVAWEDSAKLKAALKIRDYFVNRGQIPPSEHDGPMRYINSDAARVQALRVQHWPGRNGNGHHPSRWTDRNLDDDAAAATRLFPEGEFEEFYETRYPQLCWMVHGSGIAGVRFLPPEDFPALSALALRDCARFALIASEVTLRRLALWTHATVAEFEELRRRCVFIKHRIFFPDRYPASTDE